MVKPMPASKPIRQMPPQDTPGGRRHQPSRTSSQLVPITPSGLPAISARATPAAAALIDSETGTTDDGGPRRQPELSEVAEYHSEQEPACNDLALLDDDDLPLPLPRQLDPAMQRTARLASLDPDDGIQL